MPSLAEEIRDLELRRLRMMAETEQRKAEAANARLLATAGSPSPPAPPALPPAQKPAPPPPPPKNLGEAFVRQYGPNPWTVHRTASTAPANRDMGQPFALKPRRPTRNR
jgi:hypothetical protein